MSAIALHRAASQRGSLLSRLAAWIQARWAERAAAEELAALSDEALRDIGVEPIDVSRQVDTGLAELDRQRLGRIGLL